MCLLDPSNSVTPVGSVALKETEVSDKSIWINSQYAISPCHQLADDLVREHGDVSFKYLKQSKSRQKIKEIVAIIVGSFAKQLSLGYLRKEYVAIPTGKSSDDPIKLTGFSGQWLANGIEFLQSIDLIRVAFNHFYNPQIGEGRVAKYLATKKLIELLESYGLIRLRYPESSRFFVEPLPLQPRIKISDDVYTAVEDDPSAETLQWLANELSNMRITIAGISYEALRDTFDYKQGRSKVVVGKSRLVRTYSKQEALGGRFYCYLLQELPSAIRPYLRFDGASTVELDYRSMHLFLLYRRAGKVLDYGKFKNCDPYDVGAKFDLDRGEIKGCFLAALGDTSYANFISHTGHHDREHAGFSSRDRQRALECLLDAHPVLEDFLFKNLSTSLQYEDSQIALEIMSDLKAQDIPCIPVHESFVVKRKYQSRLQQIMLERLPGALIV